MSLTLFLAQFIGWMLLAVGASLLFQGKVFIRALSDITENRTTLFMVGMALYLGGVAIVLTHNIWRGGVLTVVVTLIGWALILRGAASMFMPGHSMTRVIRGCKVEEFSWPMGSSSSSSAQAWSGRVFRAERKGARSPPRPAPSAAVSPAESRPIAASATISSRIAGAGLI